MKNKALFLDRDGIINIDHGYVYQSENFEFVQGIFSLCHLAQEKGYQLIVITNQSGIGRGKYSIEQFEKLTQWMKKQFSYKGITINDVYYCPHHPTNANKEFLIKCDCRKPEPGMILQAVREHNIDVGQSVFIGDKVSDMQAAKAAGINNRLLLSSQYHDNNEVKAQRVDNIAQACLFIV
ncbi:D-glycero-beta-D-manno-heptose 1,7-bisphosphate 7-phosphatase [Thalassotalea piscium]|uniref:D,D-heptose 1,7-bisphosphate phosphatase n=1 Tax=Thalassotalea piscium TaxID=1230533 RepID=A0A7X0NIC3_9GAMM|nr:D-glycero-beta-D-manno-heptose 1,7-bisphosphate 7-phosphatase [Thalassotalea piscium]MBB6544032.1 D-glycero-D-manno-heptose 1,7-bisphosphate phosphatase [Thalassotalea piscium]